VRFGSLEAFIDIGRYDSAAKAYFESSDHYIGFAPPMAFYTVVVRRSIRGLWGQVPGELVGLAMFGRPTSPKHPQDGSWMENTRTVLNDGLPYGTASAVLRKGWREAARRGAIVGIAYHDRTRHSGCCYRKAGMNKSGTVCPSRRGWGSRPGRRSSHQPPTPKRRWSIDLTALGANLEVVR